MNVTDGDRERAFRILMPRETTPGMGYADLTDAAQAECDRIAAALAEEREKARAPFVRLADDLDREGQMVVHNGTMNRHSHITDRIRRAAEETE